MPAEPPVASPTAQRSDEDFGAWVARVREERGWSLAELAQLADVLEAQVARAEAGGVLRQQSSRARLRAVLESGERYVPPESFVERPALHEAGRRRGRRDGPAGPPTALDRLSAHVEALGGPREGGNIATQASALARWIIDRPEHWTVPLDTLLPGVGAIEDRPSAVSRTLRTHDVLRTQTEDSWSELAGLSLAQVTELPRGDRRMAIELLETAAVSWARLPAPDPA